MINDRTRYSLEEKFKNDIKFKNAIKEAFPVINNKVGRISSNIEEDNIILMKICSLGYDGYFMESKNSFHSEVGLCKKAFHKLKLEKNSEKKYMPRKTVKRSRADFEENSLIKNSPIKFSSFKGALFGDMNNMSNHLNNRELKKRRILLNGGSSK